MFYIGSCRIDAIHYLHNHVHNTKQILVTLEYLLNNINGHQYGEIHTSVPSGSIIETMRNKIKNSKTIVIEISTLKIWKNINGDLIHWAHIKNREYKQSIITKEEFLSDLTKITNLLHTKKVIFVSHINIPIAKFNETIDCNGETRWISNKFIDRNQRKNLDDNISVCNKNSEKIVNRDLIEKYIDEYINKTNKNIVHFKPYDYIEHYIEKESVDIDDFFEKNNNSLDTNHYSNFGKQIILDKIKNFN